MLPIRGRIGSSSNVGVVHAFALDGARYEEMVELIEEHGDRIELGEFVGAIDDYNQALKLDKDFSIKFLELIHNESIRKQNEIMNTNSSVEA